jgi:hypothetical protein
LTGTNRAVVRFYNQRGTAEQWIKEGKAATHWTRLSCHRFRANEVRLLLGVIAYNLGNLLRRLILPLAIQSWSLTNLQQRLFKTGGRLIRHARYFILQLAESQVTQHLFAQIVGASSGSHGIRRDREPYRGGGDGGRGRSSGGVSEQGRRIDRTHKREAADSPCVASMTSLNLPERMNELSDGVIRPFNATREGDAGPYRKSRLSGLEGRSRPCLPSAGRRGLHHHPRREGDVPVTGQLANSGDRSPTRCPRKT